MLDKPFEPQLVIARVKELLGRPVSEESSSDLWTAPPQAASTTPAQVARLDSYFAELDQAFATLGESAPAVEQAETAEPEAIEIDTLDSIATTGLLDWPGAASGLSSNALADLPLNAEPLVEASAPAPVPEPEIEPEPAPEPVAVLRAVAMPAVRAVEEAPRTRRRTRRRSSTRLRRFSPPSSTSAAARRSGRGRRHPCLRATRARRCRTGRRDITRRVLEQLSDRVVRETVASLVSEVAERLVREEIERIKAPIQ